jgi:hypothetical protein
MCKQSFDIFIDMVKKDIVITESQLNHLVNSVKVILTEADKRDVIVKIGYSKEWADEFHNLSDKYSVWIADSFLKKRMSDSGWSREETLEKINKKSPETTYTWFNGIQGTYQYILDWLRSPRREQIDLKTLTYDDAFDKSREWHDSLKVGEKRKYEETGKIIIDYRNSNGVGYYWADLGTSYCSEEQRRMGHCGRAGQGNTLISLRNINEFGEGQSFITMAYSKNGVVYDFKASGNQKPSSKYHKYIIDILTQDKYPIIELSNSGYQPETNFKLKDLTPEQQEFVFSKNEALKYNIEDKLAHPYIIEAILNGKLNFSKYSKSHQIDLLKSSNNNPKLMEMFKDNISHFNQLLLDRSAEIIFIIKNFSDVFKEILINYINNGDYGQFKRVLIVISYLLTNNKINLNEVLCEELERGFKKFKNKEMDIISTKEISKAALVCAKNYKLTDKYVYVSNPDKFKQMIVITDPNNKRFGVINQKGGVVIPAEYVTLSLAKNDTYVGRASDGEIRIFDKDGNIINT